VNYVNFTITLSVTFCIIQGDPHRPTQMDPTRPNPTRPDPTRGWTRPMSNSAQRTCSPVPMTTGHCITKPRPPFAPNENISAQETSQTMDKTLNYIISTAIRSSASSYFIWITNKMKRHSATQNYNVLSKTNNSDVGLLDIPLLIINKVDNIK